MQDGEDNSAIQNGQNKESIVELTDNKYNTASKLNGADPNSPAKSDVSPIKRTETMKRSGKVQADIEGKKNYPLSYFYGVISALGLGASLYFSADLGTRHDGFIGPASFWPGCLLTWFLFHLKDWIMWKLGKVPDKPELVGVPWCSKKRSMYFELFFVDDEEEQNEGGDSSVQKVVPVGGKGDEENKTVIDVDQMEEQQTRIGWSCPRFAGSCSRGIIELLINVALIYSFMFAEKSGINPGIISSIFSSTCVFTIIIFFFWKKQKMSCNDWLGTLFIMLCVVFISIGGGESSSEEINEGDTANNATRRMLAGPGPRKGPKEYVSPEQANMFLYFSVIAALIAGFILSINTVSLQYCVNVGCRIDQANFDGNFLMFTIFFPFYLVVEYQSPGTYQMRDLISGSLDIICITIGVIALGKGLACGDGGPMQAIENQKTVIVTIITAIVYQRMPTGLQIAGLVSGIVGVLFIVFQKKKSDPSEEGEKSPEDVKTADRKDESSKNNNSNPEIDVPKEQKPNEVR